MTSDQVLNLDRDLPVTPDDIAALRRLRADVPSWLLLDWRQLHALVPIERPRSRAPANDCWVPFSLD